MADRECRHGGPSVTEIKRAVPAHAWVCQGRDECGCQHPTQTVTGRNDRGQYKAIQAKAIQLGEAVCVEREGVG